MRCWRDGLLGVVPADFMLRHLLLALGRLRKPPRKGE